MSILKPQKILFKELRKINNLVEEFKETDEIENITLNGQLTMPAYSVQFLKAV